MSDERIPDISTRIAHVGYDDSRYCGHSVYRELAGRETHLGMAALALLGHSLSADERAVLEDIAVIVIEGDPRIWPLKATRLIASYGRDLCGVAAGTLCTLDALVGPWFTEGAAELLLRIDEANRTDQHGDAGLQALIDDELACGPRIPGFGVPFRSRDGRYVTLCRCVEERGLHERPFWQLQLAVAESVARRKASLQPNICLAVAAVCLDLGFQPRQIGPLCGVLGSNSFFANAIEGLEQREPNLLRLPESFIDYRGRSARRSARAEGKDSE